MLFFRGLSFFVFSVILNESDINAKTSNTKLMINDIPII